MVAYSGSGIGDCGGPPAASSGQGRLESETYMHYIIISPGCLVIAVGGMEFEGQ